MPNKTGMYTGIAAGLAQASNTMLQLPLAQARMEEAKLRQQRASMELQEYEQNAPMRQQQNELLMAQMQQQLHTLQATNARNTTYDAFDRFGAEPDVRYLNNMLKDNKNNPVAQRLWGNVSTFEPLYRSDENTRLLQAEGIEDVDGVYDDPELAKTFVKVIGTNGQSIIKNIEDYRALTGYNRFDRNRTLEEQEKQARVLQMLKSGQKVSTVNLREQVMQSMIANGDAANVPEAYSKLLEMEREYKPSGTSAQERLIAARMDETGESWLEAYNAMYNKASKSNEQQYISNRLAENPDLDPAQLAAEYRNLGQTSTQKHIGDVQSIRASLNEMKWLETNSENLTPAERQQVYTDYISPLEDLRGVKFTTEEKREMRNLRRLSSLGAKAGEQLTDEETGLLDKTLFDLKRYMTDDIKGQSAVTTYETFRNIFRHDLYGSAVTGKEEANFNKSLGSLGQKLNPVLEQLRTQLTVVKDNLEAIRDTNDPDIAHYYLGMPIEEVDEAVERIENRLASPRLQLKAKPGSKTLKPNQQPYDLDADLRAQGLL